MPSLRSAFAQIPILSSIRPVGQNRKAWLVDIWGVMHNGAVPFAGAVDACRRFRDEGGVVLLLSNSPRTREGLIMQLRQIGVPDDAYDEVVTSGDATRVLIADVGDRPIFHLGPERDRPTFAGLDVAFSSPDACDVVVCTGLFDDETETPADYAAMLADFKARGVRMICANPDLTVERAGRIVYCAGALAQSYAEMGGVADLAGKPHRPIYDMAFTRLKEVTGRLLSRDDVLAIGDGVKTDIKGAVDAGVDAVYVASAVHLGPGGTIDDTALMHLFPEPEGRPVAAMAALAW